MNILEKDMTNKKILFTGYEQLNWRHVGWVDLFTYSLTCYQVAKLQGYEDKNIYIVFPRVGYETNKWGLLSEEDFHWQKTEFLPWQYYERGKQINPEEWDTIINTTKRDSLFEGFPGIQDSGAYLNIYGDIHYKTTGIKPYLNTTREKLDKPYILFQYRDSKLGGYTKHRITPIDQFEYIYDIIKEYLGAKYEYWKIGEPSGIDSKFDKVIPMMLNDFDGFIKLVRNSSMIIGSHSGPPLLGYYFKDVPVIRFGMVTVYDLLNFKPRLRAEISREVISKYSLHSHPSWMNILYRDNNMIPPENTPIEMLYAGKERPPSKEDIIRIIRSNDL